MAWRLVLLALAMLWACDGVAVAAASKTAKRGSVACKHSSDSDGKSADKKSGAKKSAAKKSGDKDDDSDDDDDDEGIHFNLAGACAKLTSEVSYTYQ